MELFSVLKEAKRTQCSLNMTENLRVYRSSLSELWFIQCLIIVLIEEGA